jgi:isochorismate synthase EntC
MTYPSFRECLILVKQGTGWYLSHDSVEGATKRLSFRLYKFQLLQELKPNDRPHWRNFCTDMLNCLRQDDLFLDKIVLSDEATFHLSGKVNLHNLIIWG